MTPAAIQIRTPRQKDIERKEFPVLVNKCGTSRKGFRRCREVQRGRRCRRSLSRIPDASRQVENCETALMEEQFALEKTRRKAYRRLLALPPSASTLTLPGNVSLINVELARSVNVNCAGGWPTCAALSVGVSHHVLLNVPFHIFHGSALYPVAAFCRTSVYDSRNSDALYHS